MNDSRPAPSARDALLRSAPSGGLPIVGMVGAGQLARMTHQAAIALGQSLRVLAADPADPAALVCADVHAGAASDLPALRAFTRGCSAVTFDHEQVPQENLRALVDAGVPVHPGPDALLHAQDKLVMRSRLAGLGLAGPAFAEVREPGDVPGFAAEHGWPVVLKAVRGGYDGRGVWLLRGPEVSPAGSPPHVSTAQLPAGRIGEPPEYVQYEGRPAGPPSRNLDPPIHATDSRRGTPELVAELLTAGTPLYVEEAVPMRRELAALVARSPFGQAAAWPVVETVQEDGQCVQVLAPAPGLDADVAAGAQEMALRIAAELGVTGLLAVELFERTDGVLVVNELAMRPHNSGHWTIEGSRTSQFEQHLRAVLDYPLGATAPTAPAVVMANVLGAAQSPDMSVDERVHHLFARFPDVKVHLYGKAERPARKVGHVTVLGDDMAAARSRAALAAAWLSTAHWPDGWSPHTGRMGIEQEAQRA